MGQPLRLASRLPLALTYFVAASLSAGLTRIDGGVAFLWIATAFLIADLLSRPPSEWFDSVVPCALASALATGLFGLGWALALPFAAFSVIEALVAAWLFRRLGHSLEPLGSLSWVLHFIFSAGFAGPLLSGLLAAASLSIAGQPFLETLVRYFLAHSLGTLIVTPLALLLAPGSRRAALGRISRGRMIEGTLLLGLVAATSGAVFSRSDLPLLFLPILPVVLVTFRLGRGAAVVAVLIVAVIGGGATLSGLGPASVTNGWFGPDIQFFQFFLASTVLTVLPVAADLEHARRLHSAVRLSESRYRLMAEHSSDILLHVERNGKIRYISPSIVDAGGAEPSELVGRHGSLLVCPEHREKVRAAYLETLAADGQALTFEFIAATADGSVRWFESHSRAIVDEDGANDGVLSVLRDVSARKQNEERLSADALTDPLTGLANRRSFQSVVERRRIAPGAATTDCVAVLDIDHFKVVNDTFGHAGGDDVLRRFARIASRTVRESDLIARIGGEEFAILFPDTRVEQAMAVCDRLRTEIASSPFRAGTAVVRVTVSGGVAQVGAEGIDHALATADRALYSAKRNGRDQLALAA